MECDKNPFLEMSQDEIKKLDEVLQSEQARVLLQETTGKLFESSKPVPIVSNPGETDDSIIISSSMESLSGLSEIENLVLGSSTAPGLFTVPNDDEVVNIDTVIFPEEVTKTVESETVLMDHCYSLPADSSSRTGSSVSDMKAAKHGQLHPNHKQGINLSPVRRSRRQMERTERRENIEKMKHDQDDSDSDDKACDRFDASKVIRIEGSSIAQNERQSSRDDISNMDDDLSNETLSTEEDPAMDQINLAAGKRTKQQNGQLRIPKTAETEMRFTKSIQSPKRESVNVGSYTKQRKTSESKSMCSPEYSSSRDDKPEKTVGKRSRSESSISSEASPRAGGSTPREKKQEATRRGSKQAKETSMRPDSENLGRKRVSKKGERQIKGTPGKFPTPGSDKKNSTSHRKVEEELKQTPGNKRKKTLSFSDDVADCKTPSSEKKRHLSSGSETSNVSSVKGKNPKVKKRVARNDSLNLDLLGPALFSDPHVMGKKKADEKDEKIKQGDAQEEPMQTDDNSPDEVSEIDLIKAELELDETLKLGPAMASEMKGTHTKPESPRKSGSLPSKNTADQELRVTGKLNLKPDDASNLHTKQFPPVHSANTGKVNTDVESETERDGKSAKFAKKSKPVVESPQPERKSQRTVQKKKRIYEDDSPERSPPPPKKGSGKKEHKKRGKSYDADSDEKSKKAMQYSDDAEDSDWDSEDDPEKLWCICRKPHNNKFMIQCDKCEDWFHGTCVGITRQQGRVLEKQKKDWVCPKCAKAPVSKTSGQQHSKSSNSKTAADQMASFKKGSALLKSGDDRSLPSSISSDSFYSKSLDHAKHTNTHPNAPKTLKVPSNSKTSDYEEHYIKDNVNKGDILKKLPIKKEIVSKKEHSDEKFMPKDKNRLHSAKTDFARRIKVDPGESDGSNSVTNRVKTETAGPAKICPTNKTASASGKERTPKQDNASNIKRHSVSEEGRGAKVNKGKTPVKDVKSHRGISKRKYDCTVCLKPAPLGSVYCSSECLEKYVADSVRLMLAQKGFLKLNEEWKTKKVMVIDRDTGNLITGNSAPDLGDIVVWLKSNPTFEIVRPSLPMAKKETQPKAEPKPQVVEKTDEHEDNAKEGVRRNVRKTLKNILLERCNNADDLEVNENNIQRIAFKIEEELHKYFKDNSVKYRTKYMSLMFNIKDPRNQGLFRNILKGKIPPDVLVRMSTDELASVELAKWREQENQHSLDMIKRMQLEQQQASAGLRKKTHKGEIEIEGNNLIGLDQEIEKDIPKTPPRLIEETIEVTPEKKKEDTKEKETENDNDTTSLHRSHLFDLNCKICTGKMAPPPPEEPAPKKIRVAHSISVEHSSPKAYDSPDIPSISLAKLPNTPIVTETSDDSVDKEPTSTTHSSPDSSSLLRRSSISKSSKSQMSVWKGFIVMQDVAKFFTMAYKVSGPTDFLYQDLPDTIPVCGRIAPDQVWDYLSKIKQSGNKELIVIRFRAPSDEEAVTYNQFYMYLHSRKRYGVVNNSSKMVKDFYIIPLAAHSPVPTVLMPFDGPGLPSHRPHLLLGVLVRHKPKLAAPAKLPLESKEELVENEGSYTPPLEACSYTPPLAMPQGESEISSTLQHLLHTSSDESTTPTYTSVNMDSSDLQNLSTDADDEPYEPSYTPPLEKMPHMESVNEDDSTPYDPEQNILSMATSQQEESQNAISKLLKKISDASNVPMQPQPMPIGVTSGLEREKVLLNELSRKYQETSRKVDQSISDLKQLGASSSEMLKFDAEPASDVEAFPGLGPSGMTSFLDLPANLQEILNSVQQKPVQSFLPEVSKADVDIRCIPELKVERGAIILSSDKDTDIRTLPTYEEAKRDVLSHKVAPSVDESSSQEGTPPLCDEDSPSAELQVSDPRIKLRTNFSGDSVSSVEPKKLSLSDMSMTELMERAQKELEAIESPKIPKSSIAEPCPSTWDTTSKEPPPPGIDPMELPVVKPVPFASAIPSLPKDAAAIPPPPYVPPPGVVIPPPGFPTGIEVPPLTIPPPGYMHPPPPMLTPEDRGEHYPYPPEHPSDWRDGQVPPGWEDREWPEWDYSQRSFNSDHHPPDYYEQERYEAWHHSQRDWHPDDGAPWNEGDWNEQDSRFGRPRRWHPRHPRGNNNNNRQGRRNSFKRTE